MKSTLSALQALFTRKAILPRRRGRESFRSRSLSAERLETRAMLAADALSAWQNPALPPDVNADGYVTAMDALRIVNELNAGGARQLASSPAPTITRFSFMAAGEPQTNYYDVNGDGYLTASDALAVFNSLNAAAGEKVRVILAVTDSSGNPVTSLPIGSEFQLRAFTQDIRETATDPRGVFSAVVDVTYDPTLVNVSGPISYGASYPNQHRSDTLINANPGVLDEIGAISTGAPLGTGEVLLFIVPFMVNAGGPITFGLDSADLVENEVLVLGENERIPPAEVELLGMSTVLGFPPTVTADTATVVEDVITVIDILANDTVAPEGMEPLTVVAVTQGANGTVGIALDGQTVQYTPAANFVGQDTFTYTVEDDDGNRATGTVTVTVTAVNDPPTANPDTFTVDADETTVLDVLLNDSIAPDDTGMLRVTAVSTPSAGGTVTFPTDGQRIHYTPQPGFTGTETFSYVLSDGSGLVDMAIVTVNVRNNNPLTQPDFATFIEDSQNNVINVLANDQLAPGVEGVLLIVGADPGSQGGTVTIGPNDDTIIYTPAPNFAGTELFSYRVVDGQGGEATGMVVVTVTNVNDPPTAKDDSLTVNEDTSANTLNVLANDLTAPDTGEVLTITAVSATSNGGVVTIAPSGKSLIYTPAPGFFGQEAFTYTVSDGHGGTATATVVVTVNDVTETPTANDDTATVAEDSSDNIIDVLANDTDPDIGDTLTVSAVTQGSRGGTVEIAEDGLSVLYTPAANVFGEETFTYTASDGKGGTDTATVTVQITGANDPPTAATDSFTVVEESTNNSLNVLTNDSIAPDEVGSLLITAVGTPSAGGAVAIATDGLSLIYTPAANFAGSETFTYTIDDGSGMTAMATVTVTVTNTQDPPSANDDAINVNEDTPTPLNVLANDTDPDPGATLTITAVSATDHGGTVTIADDGLSLLYSPLSNFHGMETFSYTISDGNGGSDTAMVTITVVSVNDPPPIANDTFNVPEDSEEFELDVLENDLALSNPDGTETIIIESVSAGSEGGKIEIADDELSLLYTPVANFVGSETFTYTITDPGGQTSTGTVTVTVTSVNDIPVLTADSFTVPSGSANNSFDVLANDTDADPSTTLTITAVSATDHGGTVSIVNGQSLNYTPAAGFVGDETFTYTVSDGNGGSATQMVTVTVTAAPTGSLSGFVYVDADNDGSKDTGEQGLAGVAIRLWGRDIFGEFVDRTTTTDANGAYRFDGVVAGSYVIEETQPAGFADSKESLGTMGGAAGQDQFFLALGEGENGTNYNFAERTIQSALIGRHNFFRP
jgi:hypothetical protein